MTIEVFKDKAVFNFPPRRWKLKTALLFSEIIHKHMNVRQMFMSNYLNIQYHLINNENAHQDSRQYIV